MPQIGVIVPCASMMTPLAGTKSINELPVHEHGEVPYAREFQ